VVVVGTVAVVVVVKPAVVIVVGTVAVVVVVKPAAVSVWVAVLVWEGVAA